MTQDTGICTTCGAEGDEAEVNEDTLQCKDCKTPETESAEESAT